VRQHNLRHAIDQAVPLVSIGCFVRLEAMMPLRMKLVCRLAGDGFRR